MIKTAYEYLFIVLSGRIAMVRKEVDGFSVIPVADGGDAFSSFEAPALYWKDWVALTNFSIRYSEVDFAFLADKKDCRFAAADGKKPDQLKTAEQTVWTKQTVMTALKTVSEVIGLPRAVSVREKSKQLFDLNVGDADEPLLLHLTRFGVVKDEKDELEIAPIANEDSADQKSPSDKENMESMSVKHPEIIADSCYNDKTALKLAVGDRITGVVEVITWFGVYVRATGVKEQLKIKPSPNMPPLKVGDKVLLEVVSVDEDGGRVLFGCEMQDL